MLAYSMPKHSNDTQNTICAQYDLDLIEEIPRSDVAATETTVAAATEDDPSSSQNVHHPY